MAQIIGKIVRSKYPPENTKVLWLDTKDDLLKAFTSSGWTKVYANTEINALRNAGYLFAGIATIDTNPEIPDAKIFYIANGKGKYTNFSNINVTEDNVVILYYDNTWHKVSTGIASQEKLSELDEKVNGAQYDETFIYSKSSGYEFIPITIGSGVYTATSENVGDVVRLYDENKDDATCLVIGKNTSITFTILPDDADKYKFISLYGGQVRIVGTKSQGIVDSINTLSSAVDQVKDDTDALKCAINGYSETFVYSGGSSYQFIPFTIKEASYLFTLVGGGDEVWLCDEQRNYVKKIFGKEYVDRQIDISAEESAKITQLRLFKGTLTIKNAEKSLVERVDNIEGELDRNVDYVASAIAAANKYIDGDFKKGSNILIKLESYSGSGNIYVNAIRADGTSVSNIVILNNNNKSELWMATEDFTRIHIPFGTAGTCKVTVYGKAETSKQHIFYCGQNREIKTLKDAISVAEEHMDSILYVDSGVYDLIEEFGMEFFDSLTSANVMSGLQLKNRIHIIFSPNSKVISHYSGTNQYAQSLYSPFNTGKYGFTIENLTLECSQCRYGVHDELNGAVEQSQSIYKNCKITIDNSTNNYWSAKSCIGGGLGSNTNVVVKNCVFATDDTDDRGGVYYHNSNKTTVKDFCSRVIIKDNYFITGCVQIDDTRTDGVSGETSYLVTNNSFSKRYNEADEQGIFHLQFTNPNSVIRAWGNEIREGV